MTCMRGKNIYRILDFFVYLSEGIDLNEVTDFYDLV